MKKLSDKGSTRAGSADERNQDELVSFDSRSPDQTFELGRNLARLLHPGDVVALTGELGTGKTCLTKGIASGLEVPAEQFVRSASFVLVNKYDGVYPIWHIDAYRLDSPLDFVALGYEELIDSGCIAVIEWAERASELLPARAIRIALEHISPTERHISIDLKGLVAERKSEWKRALGGSS